jgi:hypothetical protein
MSYDAEKMAQIAQELYEFHVERAYGPEGIKRLRSVLATVKEMYLFRSPQSFSDGLLVFAALDPTETLLDPDEARVLSGANQAADIPSGAIIQVIADGRLLVWPGDVANASDLFDQAVVYIFTVAETSLLEDEEAIALPDGPRTVPNPNGYPSALAPPTFWNLEDALDYYATRLAARSTCKILRTVWAQEPKNRRLVLRNYPEVVMRESLAQHLRSSVRDAKLVRVNEEQNVSETEPVDIEVAWAFTSQLALIEIKWLGKSLNKAEDDLGSYAYADARAREGAEQLAEYLDDAYERNPGFEIQGYLVVFDARRRGVTTWEPGPVTREQAWWYESQEIDFRESVPDREDFQSPRRVFLEPQIAA